MTSQTLTLDGEIDDLVVTDLQTQAVALLAATPGIRTFVVDMAGVTFIDSSGVSLLVYIRGRCDAIGVSLRLLHVPRRAAALIEDTGLGVYLQVPG